MIYGAGRGLKNEAIIFKSKEDLIITQTKLFRLGLNRMQCDKKTKKLSRKQNQTNYLEN